MQNSPYMFQNGRIMQQQRRTSQLLWCQYAAECWVFLHVYLSACPVCYLPVEEAIALMPKVPSFSPVLKNLTYITEPVLNREAEFGGSDFGGYPPLAQRNNSYDIRESMSVHCGYDFSFSLFITCSYWVKLWVCVAISFETLPSMFLVFFLNIHISKTFYLVFSWPFAQMSWFCINQVCQRKTWPWNGVWPWRGGHSWYGTMPWNCCCISNFWYSSTLVELLTVHFLFITWH